ncbi:MAG: GIY-YIG nuclease family protein [Dysgonomonas sp.]|nr:GIY-YIG nuclease family protein [Dysgonomonas sp.]
MKPLGTHNYFVYILTNYNRTVLYTGVTNDLDKRLYEHKTDAETVKKHFTGKYNVIYLIYWEYFTKVDDAILREKQIKGWTPKKKNRFNIRIQPQLGFF